MVDGIARVLYTADGEEITVYEKAGVQSIAIQSVDMIRLLRDIKQELRKMNFQLKIITGLNVSENDLEGQE